MDDLATKWVIMTTFVFTAGALVALAWSIMSGQWNGLSEAAMVPLEDDDDLGDDGRLRTENNSDPDRRSPVGS
jgi:nitrogen fixation-related uncharacterized protein